MIAAQLEGCDFILDPMAGVGTLARYLGDDHLVWSNEIEREWAEQCPPPHTTYDARRLPATWAGQFDAIATSPACGNRMADRYAGDPKGSRRHPYRIALGRHLSPVNGGRDQWGKGYRELHREIWAECVRVNAQIAVSAVPVAWRRYCDDLAQPEPQLP